MSFGFVVSWCKCFSCAMSVFDDRRCLIFCPCLDVYSLLCQCLMTLDVTYLACVHMSIVVLCQCLKDRTFLAAARFQDSDLFQKAIKLVLRCNLS